MHFFCLKPCPPSCCLPNISKAIAQVPRDFCGNSSDHSQQLFPVCVRYQSSVVCTISKALLPSCRLSLPSAVIPWAVQTLFDFTQPYLSILGIISWATEVLFRESLPLPVLKSFPCVPSHFFELQILPWGHSCVSELNLLRHRFHTHLLENGYIWSSLH